MTLPFRLQNTSTMSNEYVRTLPRHYSTLRIVTCLSNIDLLRTTVENKIYSNFVTHLLQYFMIVTACRNLNSRSTRKLFSNTLKLVPSKYLKVISRKIEVRDLWLLFRIKKSITTTSFFPLFVSYVQTRNKSNATFSSLDIFLVTFSRYNPTRKY